MRRAAEILSSPRSAIQDYGAPALRLLGARQVFLGFGVNWTSMNNDISRCGFRNLRMFVIIVLARNTPDYFARERLYCSTSFCSSLVSLVRRHLARVFSDTFNNASSDFCFVSLPTMWSLFRPRFWRTPDCPFHPLRGRRRSSSRRPFDPFPYWPNGHGFFFLDN